MGSVKFPQATFFLLWLLLSPTGIVWSRPNPTPLADLDPLPLQRSPPRALPRPLDVDVSRLTSLGEYHTVAREDGLYPTPRFKGLLKAGHGFRVGQGLLLYEVIDGKYKITIDPPKLRPVEDYFRLQGRFRHLTKDMIQTIQERVTREYERLKMKERMTGGE